jgi:hypothetical protein
MSFFLKVNDLNYFGRDVNCNIFEAVGCQTIISMQKYKKK